MFRRIRVKWPRNVSPKIEEPEFVLDRVVLDLMDRYGEEPKLLVRPGDRVLVGQSVAESRHVITHASIDGVVAVCGDGQIVIERGLDGFPNISDSKDQRSLAIENVESLRDIGLVGMGGSMFPAMRKAAVTTNVHTLVVNGVECEPGVTIDQALLSEQSELVITGAQCMAELIGARNIILAVKKERGLVADIKSRYDFPVVQFSSSYPAGAEKLIVAKLARRMLAVGELPSSLGYQVHNVATLRALGVALRDAVPVVARPLSVAWPDMGVFRNVVVPVGMVIEDLLSKLDVSVDPDSYVVVSGGMMMGHVALLSDAVSKGTTSLIILSRNVLDRRETNCIRCGACNVACPLGLHPIGMVQRLEHGDVMAPSTRVQLDMCFLCGACEAVCPAHIPLVKCLKKGK